ncbi:MAG TPA: sigma 54-interacting transcriptional regulator, partial [Gemmataceae bacterium]|nr:sigma 54-interacting transcriptional regulator [Gemmataceae bacterium]
MAETPAPESQPASGPSDFRWQAFFQQAGDALFVLNRQRRILFVNRAWEQLTGLPAAEARLIVCTRRKIAKALARALCPPPEVLEGNAGRVRRLVPGAEAARRWWDIDFFPLRDATGFLGVLGKVTAVTAETVSAPPLPAELANVLEAIAKKHNLDQLAGRVPAVRRAIEQAESILGIRERHRVHFEVSSLSSDVPALQRAVNQARLAGQSAVPVLIHGEPGTGKYWLARTIHSLGATREQTFARLDCARLPPAALAAAMFGDAGLLQRPGLGTLYLRDPAALPREL